MRASLPRASIAVGLAAVVASLAGCADGREPRTKSSSTSPSPRASVAPTGPATQKLRPGYGPAYVTDLRVVLASVQGRTALLQVTGPGETFRVVKGEPGTSVTLARHILTVVQVAGAGAATQVTVAVRPG